MGVEKSVGRSSARLERLAPYRPNLGVQRLWDRCLQGGHLRPNGPFGDGRWVLMIGNDLGMAMAVRRGQLVGGRSMARVIVPVMIQGEMKRQGRRISRGTSPQREKQQDSDSSASTTRHSSMLPVSRDGVKEGQ